MNWQKTISTETVSWVERYSVESLQPRGGHFDVRQHGNVVSQKAPNAQSENKPNTYMEACVAVSAFQTTVSEAYQGNQYARFDFTDWTVEHVSAIEAEIQKRLLEKLGITSSGTENDALSKIHKMFITKSQQFVSLGVVNQSKLSNAYITALDNAINASVDVLVEHQQQQQVQLPIRP